MPLPPLGMLWIAAYLRERGIKVDAIDTYVDPDKSLLKKKIEWSDIVCVSGTSSHQFEHSKNIGALAKSMGKLTVFGGIHATVLPEQSSEYFDIVVRGEGELTVLEISKNYPKDFSHIRGITYKKNGTVYHNSDMPYINDLNSLPFPARDLIPPTKYPYRPLKRFEGRYTSILGARGCPNKCIFCASPAIWKNARMRSADNIFEEMMEIYNNWEIKNIHFHDDTFTLGKERVMRLCRLLIDSKIDFKWSCITRPDKVYFEMLKKMKEAGCVQIEIGAESASPRLLKAAKKNYTPQQVKEAFILAKKAGLTTYGYFIIGLPGETILTWLKSIKFARSLKLDSSVWTVLSPFPGTEVFEKKRVTILKKDCWLYKEPVIKVGWMGPKVLKLMRKIADVVVNGLGYHGAYAKKQKF